MKKYLPLLACCLLAGCFPSLDEVRTMEAACKAQGGEVRREMTGLDKTRINYIRCFVDGAEYSVSKNGKLR